MIFFFNVWLTLSLSSMYTYFANHFFNLLSKWPKFHSLSQNDAEQNIPWITFKKWWMMLFCSIYIINKSALNNSPPPLLNSSENCLLATCSTNLNGIHKKTLEVITPVRSNYWCTMQKSQINQAYWTFFSYYWICPRTGYMQNKFEKDTCMK